MARKRQGGSQPPAGNARPVDPLAREDGRVPVHFVRDHEHRGVRHKQGELYWATPEEQELLLRFGAIGVP